MGIYLKPLSVFMPCFMAKNLAPKTAVSTVHYFFENHCNNVVFIYIKKPLIDLHDKTLCLLDDHYPQTCRYQPPYLKVLQHSLV